MALLAQIIEPLVEDNIAAPAAVEFLAMLEHESPQGRMPLPGANSHDLGQLAVQISPHRHVRIHKQPVVRLEVIGKRQRQRVATAFENLDMQVALPGHPGTKTAIQAAHFGYQAQQTQIVALIQRHQPDKTPGLRDGLRDKM